MHRRHLYHKANGETFIVRLYRGVSLPYRFSYCIQEIIVITGYRKTYNLLYIRHRVSCHLHEYGDLTITNPKPFAYLQNYTYLSLNLFPYCSVLDISPQNNASIYFHCFLCCPTFDTNAAHFYYLNEMGF